MLFFFSMVPTTYDYKGKYCKIPTPDSSSLLYLKCKSAVTFVGGERGSLVVNASDSGSRGRGFEPHSGQTVLCPSARHIYSPKVLVIPRKRWLCPNMTEKLFTGTLRINQLLYDYADDSVMRQPANFTLNVLVSVFHKVKSGKPLLVCLGSLTYLSNIPAITRPPIQLTKP